MNTYFLDSSFIIALINIDDELHKKAIELAEKILYDKLIISELIINEVITVIGNKINIETALKTFNLLTSNKYIIINEYDLYDFDNKNIINYETYNKNIIKKKRMSYTDTGIITIMEELGINKLISYDKQFDRVQKIDLINNL